MSINKRLEKIEKLLNPDKNVYDGLIGTPSYCLCKDECPENIRKKTEYDEEIARLRESYILKAQFVFGPYVINCTSCPGCKDNPEAVARYEKWWGKMHPPQEEVEYGDL